MFLFFSVTDCDQNYMLMINLKKLPEFGYKLSYQKKILAKIFLPKKIPKSKILNPQKSFDHPCHLKSGVPTPELKLQKVLTSISLYYELEE